MDYNTLVDQIKQYAKRTDTYFLNQIPYIIDFAVNGIYLGAKNIGFETRMNGNLNANSSLLNKPVNWKETVSFLVVNSNTVPASYELLLLRTPEFCQTYNNTNATGVPKFYSDFGYEFFYFAPAPNQNYVFQVTYLGLPLFNEENPTNFLTERYDTLLLSGCLYQTAIFLKDYEQVPLLETNYRNQLALVNQSATALYTDRTSRRDKT